MSHADNMTGSVTLQRPVNIYHSGVPSSEKTTLIEALATRLYGDQSVPPFAVLREVARELILGQKVHHSDIKAGNVAAVELQQLILKTQAVREQEAVCRSHFVVSDRSGIDPVAFATKDGGDDHSLALLTLDAWRFLRPRMQRGLVILCEPCPQWFVEDGVRIVLTSLEEISELRTTFCDLLHSESIDFHILPASSEELSARIGFVTELWRQTTKDQQ